MVAKTIGRDVSREVFDVTTLIRELQLVIPATKRTRFSEQCAPKNECNSVIYNQVHNVQELHILHVLKIAKFERASVVPAKEDREVHAVYMACS